MTFTVRVYRGAKLIETIPGFTTRAAASARATRESRGLRIAVVGSN